MSKSGEINIDEMTAQLLFKLSKLPENSNQIAIAADIELATFETFLAEMSLTNIVMLKSYLRQHAYKKWISYKELIISNLGSLDQKPHSKVYTSAKEAYDR